MQRALGALSGLLGALLDLSRLDAGTVEPKPAPLALEDILDTLHSQFAGPARAQGLRFASVPSRLWVETDRGRCCRCCRTSAPMRCATTAAAEACWSVAGGSVGQRVTIQVLDTGIGIAPEEQARVFGEFYQVAGAGRGREQGLGLGLAIVQRTARLLGGELIAALRARARLLLRADAADVRRRRRSSMPRIWSRCRRAASALR
ncbi:sensor histidine kinase [Plasticicumulans sp.]|uniref:sensor histidine kinase n=1 Tax=Plasticicumulans sp. TaxID=2307179 RepID=UPI0039452303